MNETDALLLIGLGAVLGILASAGIFWLMREKPDDVWFETVVAFGHPRYPVKVEGHATTLAEACRDVDQVQRDGIEDRFPNSPYVWHKITRVTHELLEDTEP